MSQSATADAEPLFARWGPGDAAARTFALQTLYGELTAAAALLLRREGAVSLTAGDLVHECVLRLMTIRAVEVESRAHFLSLAARLMRRALVDHVRAKHADKRRHERVTLTARFEPRRAVDLLELDEALLRLKSLDAERSEIVEMRYFGGMTHADIAEVLCLSEKTVKRRWTSARAWLIDAMRDTRVVQRSGA